MNLISHIYSAHSRTVLPYITVIVHYGRSVPAVCSNVAFTLFPIKVFYLEDGCGTFLRNFGLFIQNYTASHARTQ